MGSSVLRKRQWIRESLAQQRAIGNWTKGSVELGAICLPLQRTMKHPVNLRYYSGVPWFAEAK